MRQYSDQEHSEAWRPLPSLHLRLSCNNNRYATLAEHTGSDYKSYKYRRYPDLLNPMRRHTMPVQNASVTSEFGARVHPVTGKQSFHTGIDLAGTWHSNITAVEKGTVVWAGVQRGYGNCVEVQHSTVNGTIYFTFYAHLARIDVMEGQEIQQGTVVGIQGGDPNRDPNPRI